MYCFWKGTTSIPTGAVAHFATYCGPADLHLLLPQPLLGHWDLLLLMLCHWVVTNARDTLQARRLPAQASKSLMCSHIFWGASEGYLFVTELQNSEGSVPDDCFHTRYELGFFSLLVPV